ncbi:winged helix-turn-helix domain-containing protein [Planosporangium sp. 12N6]|uniref:winged helix-turn-helix domain-containing protein n=1 Tax=Planosporangium spinosum TaxID=3402278 RepID=UPI003CE99D03
MPVTPDYIRISDALEDEIRSGARKPHSKLPSIAELRKQYGVSDSTVKMVLIRLEARGVVYRHQGRGIYVTDTSEWYDRRGS